MAIGFLSPDAILAWMAFLSNGLPPFESYYDVSERNDNTGHPAGFFVARSSLAARLAFSKRA